MSRRRSSRTADAAGALFSVTSSAGAGYGLYWAAKRPVSEPADSCSSQATDAIGKCFGDSLVETFTPYVIAGGVGLLAGAALAFTLVIAAGLVGRLRRIKGTRPASSGIAASNPSRATSPRRPAVALASTTRPHGRSMRARYVGACAGCGRSIRPGDRITHLGHRNNRCSICS